MSDGTRVQPHAEEARKQLLPPIKCEACVTEPQVIRSTYGRDGPHQGTFTKNTSSSAARARAHKRRESSQKTLFERVGETGEGLRRTPGFVQRHDRARKMLNVMRDAMDEVTKLDKQLSLEAQYLQRRRARKQRSRRVASSLTTPQWNHDASFVGGDSFEKTSFVEERHQREEQARVQRREAVARLALSAEVQTNDGLPKTRVPRTSIPMELLFSANRHTSQDMLDKLWLNKGKEEKHARLAAKLLPRATAEGTADRKQMHPGVTRAGPRSTADCKEQIRKRETGRCSDGAAS